MPAVLIITLDAAEVEVSLPHAEAAVESGLLSEDEAVRLLAEHVRLITEEAPPQTWTSA